MGPRYTRNCAVLRLENPTYLISFLKSDVDREPQKKDRLLKISSVSATKGEVMSDSIALVSVRFWGRKAAESWKAVLEDAEIVYSREFQMPSWWTPKQFLGALYVMSNIHKCWVIQTIRINCGLLSGPCAAVSDVACAFSWTPSELDALLQRYGGNIAVSGGDN